MNRKHGTGKKYTEKILQSWQFGFFFFRFWDKFVYFGEILKKF